MLRICPSARARSLRNTLLLLAALLVSSGVAVGQAPPSVPPVPAPPAAGGVGGKLASCAGSICGLLSSGKRRCCDSPLGQLLNGAIKPLSLATGGVIPTPCPGPHEPSRQHPSGGGPGSGNACGPPGPQQAAQAIKLDQAQAKARSKAVRYLATVPCHYYPEAEVALITALRTDRSECVRWEAAHALAQGCCCTKRTIEALNIVVSGSSKDGNPAELSSRVRTEAVNALQHCLAVCGDTLPTPQRPEVPAPAPETLPEPLPPPERPETPSDSGTSGPAATGVRQANYYAEVERRPTRELLAEARQLLDSARLARAYSLKSQQAGKSLLELWRRSDKPPAIHRANTSPSGATRRDELPPSGDLGATHVPTLAAPQSPALGDSPLPPGNSALLSVLRDAGQRSGGPLPRASATTRVTELPWPQVAPPYHGQAVPSGPVAGHSRRPTQSDPWINSVWPEGRHEFAADLEGWTESDPPRRLPPSDAGLQTIPSLSLTRGPQRASPRVDPTRTGNHPRVDQWIDAPYSPPRRAESFPRQGGRTWQR